MIGCGCTHCGSHLEVNKALAGRNVPCPGCGSLVAVPVPASAALARPVEPSTTDMPPQPSPLTEGLDGHEPPAQTGWRTDRVGSQPEETASPHSPGAAPPERYDFLAPAAQPGDIGRLGPYRVLEVLGAGGMGVVFRAQDPQLERCVALKALLPAIAGRPSARERFLREARAAAALKHPHIVTIFHVGEEHGAPFLAMELLEGSSLDDYLKSGRALPVAAMLHIGRQIAEGLAAAHAQGLIHRDIKPANLWLECRSDERPRLSPAQQRQARLLVATDCWIKILDFGLARVAGDATHLTQTGSIVGTPAYMAPEQAGDGPVDHRCDLFSLGCVLYRMATGRPPFHGKDTLALLSSLALVNPPPPCSINPEIPVALSELVMRLLAKDPEQRPQSAREVAETLGRMEREPALPGPAPRPRQPRGMGLWMLVGGGAALGLLLAWLIFLRPGLNEEGDPSGQQAATSTPDKEELVVPGEIRCLRTNAVIRRAAFSADARLALVAGPGATTFQLWDLVAGNRLGDFVGHTADVLALAFSRDGRLALSGSRDGTVRLWYLQERKLLKTLEGHTSWVRGVAFIPGGRQALSGDNHARILQWDLRTGLAVKELTGHWAPINLVSVGPAGRYAASSSWDPSIRIWDLKAGKEIRTLAGVRADSCEFSADERLLLSGNTDNSATLWDVASGKELAHFSSHDGLDTATRSADGKWILTGGRDNMLRLWDAASGTQLHKLMGHTDAVLAVAFLPDGRRALSAGADGTFRTWQLPTKRDQAP
jgi:serine/threonine protein kinase/WD40 repeat protein